MKILLWDIETAPLLVEAWTLWKPRLDHHNIVEDFSLISAAWKWMGEKKIHSVSVNPTYPRADALVVETLHNVLSEADVLVAHNGDAFDLRKFNARALYHGWPPIPPIRTIDTLKVARKHFGFTSNRLDYLARYMGLGKKINTGGGMGLWKNVMKSNAKALAKMIRYNKNDVAILELVYLALRPWIRNHPNENLTEKKRCCPTCGSRDFGKQGTSYNRTTARQQYKCNKCGSWFSGELQKKAEVA